MNLYLTGLMDDVKVSLKVREMSIKAIRQYAEDRVRWRVVVR